MSECQEQKSLNESGLSLTTITVERIYDVGEEGLDGIPNLEFDTADNAFLQCSGEDIDATLEIHSNVRFSGHDHHEAIVIYPKTRRTALN